MKRMSYLVLFMLICMGGNAQSLWNDGIDGSFDNWETVNGTLLPKGWYGTAYDGSQVSLIPATDRYGRATKACKITSNFTGATDYWYSWHLAAATVDNVSNGTLNVLNIAKDTEFYYTFWAKADVAGLKMYIGVPQMYDPNHGAWGWDDMPYVELTTEWKQYGILQKSNYDATSFSIQLRGNKTFYIDDIVLERGTVLPELNVEKPGPSNTLWSSTIDPNFELWSNGVPLGWKKYANSSRASVSIEETQSRNNGEKAARVKITGSPYSYDTWHFSLDSESLNIPINTSFYYRFWAKADADGDGTKMFIGVPNYYNDTSEAFGDYYRMPYVTLTTEWKQYTIFQPANSSIIGKTFTIHLRDVNLNKWLYIDDIELVASNELPENPGIVYAPSPLIGHMAPGSLSNLTDLKLGGRGEGESGNRNNYNTGYNADQYAALKTALGDNQVITSITVEKSELTNIDSYLSDINPNCLKYVPSSVTTSLPNFVSGTTAISEIEITDELPFSCPAGIKTNASGVSYTRQCYNDGNWESIILPFAVTEFAQFADYTVEGFKEVTGTDNNILKFEAINNLTDWQANTAYLMKANNAGTAANYTFANRAADVTVQTAAAANGFTGAYSLESGENKYFLNTDGDAFGIGNELATIPAFRAFYLPAQSGAPMRFDVEHDDNGATSINDAKHNEDTDAPRKVMTKDGLRIISGKKIYAADGQLIGNL